MKETMKFLSFFLFITQVSLSQSGSFNIDAYKAFLNSNQNLSSSQLMSIYPAGSFGDNLNITSQDILYMDSVELKYGLTQNEKDLVNRNGFMVTERLSYPSFGHAFGEIWNKDLPVFISTDAILHAIHMSYDEILKRVEVQVLIPNLTSFLSELKKEIPQLHSTYSANAGMMNSLRDVDLYLTVAERLLGSSSSPFYASNESKLTDILGFITAEQPVTGPLFSETDKIIDYSQFKVRGHYTDTNYPQLAKYFQSMMWLGRIELYLIAPKASQSPQQTFADIQRQIIDAVLINEAVQLSNMQSIWNEIDGIIKFMVGESDNVTLVNLQDVVQSIGINNTSELSDSTKVLEFQDTLKTKSYAFQRILSQILMTGFDQPDSIVPASAFLLFGQRFIIDSYVTSQVVFDRILYQGTRPLRMLPSTLDILFALGNDGSAQLLKDELDRYHYSTNLAALRYLIDSYGNDFWNASLYNHWLNSIRTLNPPRVRTSLPVFMQTAAWWQEKMNTQLASWAQLRHDNLLYAKQSYSGGTVCSFPYAYVEPIPEFYAAVGNFAKAAGEYFKNMSSISDVTYYFDNVSKICDTLYSIADKELKNENINETEKLFLSNMLYEVHICGIIFDGWYTQLFYEGEDSMLKKDLVVADVHTAPTDEFGNMVGWVLHAGTGPINLGVFTAKTGDNKTIAFVGPVMSYYEHVTTNFYRLTDEEWATAYAVSPSFRPSYVNIYLADSTGGSLGAGLKLITSVQGDKSAAQVPRSVTLARNFPNPFNSSTIIKFSIPYNLSNSITKLIVYNIQGQLIKQLVDQHLPAGNYYSKWDGTNENNVSVSSGIYFYTLTVGKNIVSGKMILMK